MSEYYLYFMGCDFHKTDKNAKIRQTPFYKVGIARDVQKRRDQIQTGNPAQIVIYGVVRARSKREALLWEKAVLDGHKFYEAYGEWINVGSKASALEPHKVVSKLCKTIGIESYYRIVDGEWIATFTCDYQRKIKRDAQKRMVAETRVANPWPSFSDAVKYFADKGEPIEQLLAT